MAGNGRGRLIVDHHVGACTHHPLDSETAAAAAGPAGIRHQRVTLHHDRKLEFGLLVGAAGVSLSLMQTVPETPSSVILAPHPPPSGPKLPMKNSAVRLLIPWNDDASRPA